MNKFLPVAVALILIGCGETPKEVPPQTKIFNENGYKPMAELIDAVQFRDMDIMTDNEPEDVDWYGVPVKNICFVDLGEAWRYHKNDEITLVPLGSSGTYAIITPVGYDSTHIEVSSLHSIPTAGMDDFGFENHFNVPVTIMYKFCDDSS